MSKLRSGMSLHTFVERDKVNGKAMLMDSDSEDSGGGGGGLGPPTQRGGYTKNQPILYFSPSLYPEKSISLISSPTSSFKNSQPPASIKTT